jgi:hypothetical protein
MTSPARFHLLKQQQIGTQQGAIALLTNTTWIRAEYGANARSCAGVGLRNRGS